jgi:DNA-binding beta-propeller fold protein YncE
VRIPLRTVAAHETAQDSNPQLPALAVSKGGEDEPPQGPDGFDVSPDGSFLITDPLMQRLAQFSADGRFLRTFPLGFAPASVTIRPDGTTQVKAAQSSDVFVLDQSGELHPSEASPPRPLAKIASPHDGQVWPGDTASSPIAVKLDNPALTLLSLQLAATGEDGSAYVAVETTSGQDTNDGIDVKKSIRRYSRDGKLINQTDDIPLDYYIAPNDELRVHKGIVYQLMTTPTELHINIWNLN